MQIGNRPLHLAVGAGHHNRTGGSDWEVELNGRVCRAVVELCRISTGFEARCYTPDEGLGIHPGPVDEMPRKVALEWDPVWRVDIFHEIHAQAAPDPTERGVFTIYPDGAGLESSYPNPGELDYRIRDYGAVMVEIIASAVALPMGGPHGTGIMSERHTWIGRRGRRLRIFAATATEGMIEHSCRFISEVGCHTNGLDRAIMSQPSFPGRQAAGILQAYAALARAHLGWTYDYSIAAGTARTI